MVDVRTNGAAPARPATGSCSMGRGPAGRVSLPSSVRAAAGALLVSPPPVTAPLVPPSPGRDPDTGGDDATRPGESGFRDFVTSRQPGLLRAAYLLTGNRADAEDLVQAALAKSYLAWDRIEDRGAVDGYVRRAMVNTHISWWRRRRVEEYPTGELPDRAAADAPADSELGEALRRAVDRLPERMRAAVLLRYYEDMSEAEIASALGVSAGTVKSTVSRAMAKLRIDAELLAP